MNSCLHYIDLVGMETIKTSILKSMWHNIQNIENFSFCNKYVWKNYKKGTYNLLGKFEGEILMGWEGVFNHSQRCCFQ